MPIAIPQRLTSTASAPRSTDRVAGRGWARGLWRALGLGLGSGLGLGLGLGLGVSLLATPVAHAEKADRQKPLAIEADRSSTIDLARRTVVFDGRVVLTQGTLRITADRMEVTEPADGQRTAVARGLPEVPAEFREKRDGLDETVEGRAQTIEYDSREELIRLSGKAVVRRMRGKEVADEYVGETIVWNGAKEFFSVMPAPAGGAGGAAGGSRVRAVFSPQPAKPAGPAGSAPAQATPAQAMPSPATASPATPPQATPARR